MAGEAAALLARLPVTTGRVYIDILSFDSQLFPSIEQVELRGDSATSFHGWASIAGQRIVWQLDLQDVLSIRLSSAEQAATHWEGQMWGEPLHFSGNFDVKIALQNEGEGRSRVAASLLLTETTLRSSRLADRAVDLSPIEANLEARIDGPTGRVEALAEASWAEIPLYADVTAQYDGLHYRTEAVVGLASLCDCDTIWTSVPDALVPNLADALVLGGQWQPELSLHFRTGDPNSLRISPSSKGGCQVESVDERWDAGLLGDEAFVGEVMAERGRIEPGKWSPVGVKDVRAYVYRALQVHEDPGFDLHQGVSAKLVASALRKNWVEGEVVYGGSTLTQQIIKNLFLTRKKTFERKLEEAVLAWATTGQVSKERQLAVYMNIAEFGDGIYGVDKAGEHYFGKPAAQLSPLEAAYLAVLLPWPHQGAEHLRAGHSPDNRFWRHRILTVLSRLETAGYLDATQVEAAAPYVVHFSNSPMSRQF